MRERVHLPTLLSVIERVRADGVDFNQALNDNMAKLIDKDGKTVPPACRLKADLFRFEV